MPAGGWLGDTQSERSERQGEDPVWSNDRHPINGALSIERKGSQEKSLKINELQKEIVKVKEDAEDRRKVEVTKIKECEEMMESLGKEIKEATEKLQTEIAMKEEKARIARELRMELIRNNSSGDERSALRAENLALKEQIEIKSNKIQELEEELNLRTNQLQEETMKHQTEMGEMKSWVTDLQSVAKDMEGRTKELEQELTNKTTTNEEKITGMMVKENRLRSDIADLNTKCNNLEKEKKTMGEERAKMSEERGKLTKEVKEERELTHRLSAKLRDLLDKSNRNQQDLTRMSQELDTRKKRIEIMENSLSQKDQALKGSNDTRRRLEERIKEKSDEIRRLEEKEKRMRSFKGIREIEEIPENSMQEEHIKEKAEREKIKRGGFFVCLYHIEDRCMKLGDCIFPHPPLCAKKDCEDTCWKVHLKDLNTKEERNRKFGAVPYKMEGRQNEICRYDGNCWRGDRCTFRHTKKQYPQPLRRPRMEPQAQEEIRAGTSGTRERTGKNQEEVGLREMGNSRRSNEEIEKLLKEVDNHMDNKNL